MDDLLGMRVKDEAGRMGCISAATPTELEIEWVDEEVLAPKVECLRPLNPKIKSLQILTLTEGWMPVSELVEEVGPTTLLEDLESLLVESEPLEEKKESGKSLEKKARASKRSKEGSSHNPFRTKSRLGPGPRHGTNSKTGAWHCSCPTPYKCQCRGIGGKKKTIRIKKSYKKPYNAAYKSWRKNQKY